jgi:hypothetical protein
VPSLLASASPPALLWARDWGGGNYDYAYDIALASDGGVIIVGQFVGPADMDPTVGVDMRDSHAGGHDLSITWVNADGSYAWCFTTGGDGAENCDAVAIDPRDQGIIVSGYFWGTVDFDPGEGEEIHTAKSPNAYNAFILKLTRVGELEWVRSFGGTSYCEATDIAVDVQGNITHTGYFGATVDFDLGPGFELRSAADADWDAYVSQIGPDLEHRWTHTFGGQSFGLPDFGLGIAVGPDGGILATGEFHGSTDFDPGQGMDQRTSKGFADIYLTRYSREGERLWTWTAGGPASERGWAAAFGPGGEAFVTGRFRGTMDFDPGPEQDPRTSNGESDLFVTKFHSDGEYEWTRTAGGNQDYDEGRGMVAMADGSVLTGGWFRSPTVDFDPGDGTDLRQSAGEIDMLLWHLGPDGSYLGTTTWGSTFHDRIYTVLLDGQSTAYVCGFFSETIDLDPGDGIDLRVSDGLYDSVLMKLSLGEECAPDCTGDGALDLFDFLCFVNLFNAGDELADCTGDGVRDLFDFLCFVNLFNAGC